MKTKVCGKCKLVKDICLFGISKQTKNGYRSTCNDCRKIESREYKEKNKERRNETVKNYYQKNKEKISEKTKLLISLDVEKNRAIKLKSYHKNKEKNKEKLKLYRIKNRDRRTKYQREKINNDELYKLSSLVRSRIRNFLKIKKWVKTSKTFNLVGCSPEFLKEHLQSKFEDGMSWDNYGSWHIDHIIPLSSAKTTEEFNKLCHYTNLQPLWASENLSKGDKIIN
jgi:hypothetical protein